MNPSASGWITKLLKELDQNVNSVGLKDLYTHLRACGFIYGSNQHVVNHYIANNGFTKDEACKINLVIALLVAYNENPIDLEFKASVIDFYTNINQYKTTFFDGIITGKNPESTVEKIIHKRIQIDDNYLTKNFNYFITNALLFVDVLAYHHFLTTTHISESYLQQLEASIKTITVAALNVKKVKTSYDRSLIKLLESSLRYQQIEETSYHDVLPFINDPLEAQYILDLACMATWSDQVIDSDELHFLQKFGRDIDVGSDRVQESINAVNAFYSKNKDNIALFTSKNAVQNFYDNSSAMVSRLISRNKKRLSKELRESKELMRLLSQSTLRELTDEEQKKVQDQLLDIFKTIPSLAIFLLPGGAILLPIVIKFIPKLLPSAFDDNRLKD